MRLHDRVGQMVLLSSQSVVGTAGFASVPAPETDTASAFEELLPLCPPFHSPLPPFKRRSSQRQTPAAPLYVLTLRGPQSLPTFFLLWIARPLPIVQASRPRRRPRTFLEPEHGPWHVVSAG